MRHSSPLRMTISSTLGCASRKQYQRSNLGIERSSRGTRSRASSLILAVCALSAVAWLHLQYYSHNGHGKHSTSGSSSGTLIRIRQLHSSVVEQQRAPDVATSCESRLQPPIALLMVILGHENATRHDQYWMAVANRRAYASEHGFPVYLVTDTVGSGEHPAWEKLVALQAVFQHSCAEWVWMQDADAYIMNLERSIMDLAHNPVARRNPKQVCDTPTPDIIAAGACLTRINTGSMLWKNTDWTRQFVSDAWHSKFIARPLNWWDQAAVLHMYKMGDSKQHMCIVNARELNAFPNITKCHDGGGTFQDGDLMVHFPGGMKTAIANMSSSWLQSVPVVPSNRPDAATKPALFTITRAASCTAAGSTTATTGSTAPKAGGTTATTGSSAQTAGKLVHVTLHSDLYNKESQMKKEFELCIQPQAQGFSNWGWPIAPQPDQFAAVLQQQLQQRQEQQQLQQ